MSFNSCSPRRCEKSDAEAFPAAALALDVGVSEAKRLVQALFDEIDDRAVDERETRRVDEHLDAAVFENDVVGLRLIGIVDDVSKARAARLAHAETQAQTLPAGGEEGLDASGGG